MSVFRTSLSWIQRQWSWLRWLVALGLLAFLFYQNYEPFRRLTERSLEWMYLGLGFVVCSIAIVLTFVRWYLLVWAQEFPFRLSDALRLSFIAYLFNYMAPGVTGGDLVKAVMIARRQQSRRSVAAATVLLDRLLGLLALFLVGAFASLVVERSLLEHGLIQTIVILLWTGALSGVVALGLMLHPAVPRWRAFQRLTRWPYLGGLIGDLLNAVQLYQSRWRVLMAAIGISVLGHFGILSCFYLCSRALQVGEAAPGYWAHILLIPGAELIGVVTPTPGGLGALEGAVQTCYAIAAQASGTSVARELTLAAGLFTAIAFRAVSLLVAAIGAGYYLTVRREIEEVLEESAAEQRDQNPSRPPENEPPSGDGVSRQSSGEHPTASLPPGPRRIPKAEGNPPDSA